MKKPVRRIDVDLLLAALSSLDPGGFVVKRGPEVCIDVRVNTDELRKHLYLMQEEKI